MQSKIKETIKDILRVQAVSAAQVFAKNFC